MSIILLPLISYLLGSILFGPILTKIFNKGDLSQIGSGNVGATNVLRAGGKFLAIATLLGDGGKAILAMSITEYYSDNLNLVFISGISVFFGHLYSIFYFGKGGKGVITTFCIYLYLFPFITLLAMIIWLLIAYVYKYSSLAGLISLTLLYLSSSYFSYMYAEKFVYWIYYGLVILIFVFYRHRQNIFNLTKGTEAKINLNKNKPYG